MVKKTIDRTDEDKQKYESNKTLKEQIQADKGLEEWMSLVEQYSSQDTVQADVLGVGLDDDTITITYQVPIGNIEVEERFNHPYTISRSYEINRLLRGMYGDDVSLDDAVDKLRREEEIPVKFDLEDGIQGIHIPEEQMKQYIEENIQADFDVTIGKPDSENGDFKLVHVYILIFWLFLSILLTIMPILI